MSKSGECEKKCYNWAKLRFQGKPQELICGSKTRRPQLKWTPKEIRTIPASRRLRSTKARSEYSVR